MTSRKSRTRTSSGAAFAVMAVLLSACAGPQAPFHVGTQAAPVNLILGAHTAVMQAPVGPVTSPLPRSLPPFIPLPDVDAPEVDLPEVVVEPVPCPSVDKQTPVSSPGLPLIEGPPQPGSYTYLATTTDTVGKGQSTYRGESTWKVTVSPMDVAMRGWHVTVDTSYAETTTRRVFLVVPETLGKDAPLGLAEPAGTDPNVQVIDTYNGTVEYLGLDLPLLPRSSPNVGRFGPAGIYLESVQTGDRTFTPTVPMPLLQLPLQDNTFTAIGSDGGTAMSYKSSLKSGQGTVNACGKKVGAAQISITEGAVASRMPDGTAIKIDFEEALSFGLQFGGVPIADSGSVSTSTLLGVANAPEAIKRTFDFTTKTILKPYQR